MKLPSQPLVQSLHEHALVDPQQVAFLTDQRPTTYQELIRRIGATVGRLARYGIQKRDRVLLIGPNHDDLAVAYFAIHSLKAIAVPVDPNSTLEEIEFITNDATPALALVKEKLELSIHQQTIDRFTESNNDDLDWRPNTTLEDDADLLYTTGTTGRKKGILLSQRNIAAAALNISSFIGNTKSDLEVLPIPLSHSFGLGRLRSMALVGNTLALEPGLRNPARLLKRILDLRANGLALVPAGFELMLGLTRGKLAEAQEYLKYIEIGSAPMREETKRELMELLPHTRICHHYGLTEASRACFFEFHTDSAKPGSVGKPSPNVTISIVDDVGNPVPPGESGEIVVAGAMTMKRYWQRPDLDAKSFVNGGLRTGDIGYMDDDGYVYLLGRQGDLINVGGLKVAPDEVDSVLLTHQAINDCACVGIPDRITGEKIKMFYVSDRELDIREVLNWLRPKLVEYKIPKTFERIKQIPKTASGKVQRQHLKQMHDIRT